MSIYTITQLVKENYPRILLEQIAHSQEFPQVGFSTGEKRKTYYFNKEKLDKYLERREEIERS